MADEDKVVCETPTPGKQSTRIDRFKYDCVRRAILESVPEAGEGLEFRDLPGEVAKRLTEEERSGLGSIAWYTTTVKLDLEVKGEVRRVPGVTPQRLLKV